MRDYILESLANEEELSTMPFQMEKEDYLWR